MKKVLIIDGNENERSQITKDIGTGYDVSVLSSFDIKSMALSTVITIANTLDSLDVYSGGKSLRIAVCARDIARNLGWDEKDCDNVYFAALLHDFGMITVSENIRNKPGRLDAEEYAAVKTHTVRGAGMLRDITIVDGLHEGILSHHERWDGSGYPNGLSGEEIPKIARVIAVADAYDAMSSERIYRSSLFADKIISEFTRCRGGQFDPDIADVFIFMLKEGYTVDPGIEQTREARQKVSEDSGASLFAAGTDEGLGDNGEKDTLTGLFTRSYLNTIVGKKIFEERSGAFMMIDIMGFDALKSQYGREESDSFVSAYSNRLRSIFREADVVCRIAGDMFAVYVSGQSGKVIAGKKAEMIAEMTETYDEFEKYRSLVRTAIGIAMCMEDGVTFEELYGAALQALEKAKDTGGICRSGEDGK